MSLLDRDPRGHFISCNSALGAWLPVLLSNVYPGALDAMLRTAARWCDAQAARQLRIAADALSADQDRWEHPELFAKRRIEDADTWFRRKAVLLEAAAKLEEIR